MSTYYLSRPGLGFFEESPPPPEILDLFLESSDGSQRLALDGSTGWTLMPGVTGLDMPPMDIVTAAIPGVPGSGLQDVRVAERPVFLPIVAVAGSGGLPTHLAMMDTVRRLVDPQLGTFRLIGVTNEHEREMTVVYTGGLEGAYGQDEFGLSWRKFGLTAIACEPFARARADRMVEFGTGGGAGVFLGAVGGTNAWWPRALSSSAVIGENMRVSVASEVPVYPAVELVGPMDSFSGTVSLEDASLPPYFGGAEWSVDVPDGVPAGSTLRLVTDPRARSIRLDGALAAGLVARGSSLRPFYPGVNVMSVVAPGGTAATRVRISWRELYRSLW